MQNLIQKYFILILFLIIKVCIPAAAQQSITIADGISAKSLSVGVPTNSWVEVARFNLPDAWSNGNCILNVADLANDVGNKATYSVNITIYRTTAGANAVWNYTTLSQFPSQSKIAVYTNGNTISVYQYNDFWGSRTNAAQVVGTAWRSSTTVWLYPNGVSAVSPVGFKIDPGLPISLVPEGGNVLIGKGQQVNSSYKLDIAGKVRADEIIVNTTGADFVFEPSYSLMPLQTVEKFISENNHLPDIPSAKEMQATGLPIGEINTRLLQKIEELTLYVIDQHKRLGQQHLELQQQKQELNKQAILIHNLNNTTKK